jgi:hypothetical protein
MGFSGAIRRRAGFHRNDPKASNHTCFHKMKFYSYYFHFHNLQLEGRCHAKTRRGKGEPSMMQQYQQQQQQTTTRNGKQLVSLWMLVLVLVMGSLQVMVNLLLYSNLNHLGNKVTLESFCIKITNLKEPVNELQEERDEFGGRTSSSRNSDRLSTGIVSQDDTEFYSFTIRDARHLVPVQIPYGFHVYDYVDVHSSICSNSSTGQNQESTANSELFVDGYPAGTPTHAPPCQEYSLICYMQKIFQVFNMVLHTSLPTVSHFFFMEANNDLCIPLLDLKDLALQENRYFLGTRIGFSGWIMSCQFLQNFLNEYQFHCKFLEPDVVAATMLMEQRAWAMTRQYLVSYTTLPLNGATALTMTQSGGDKGGGGQWSKHLPQCMEPHQG